MVLLAALPAPASGAAMVLTRQTVIHHGPWLRHTLRSQRTWADFLDKNDDPRCLPAGAAGREWTLFGHGDVPHDLRRGGFWDWFHQRYPAAQGLSRASRVGFSPDGEEALVELSYSCGWLCGHGEQVLLVREAGRWRVVLRQRTWVS